MYVPNLRKALPAWNFSRVYPPPGKWSEYNQKYTEIRAQWNIEEYDAFLQCVYGNRRYVICA